MSKGRESLFDALRFALNEDRGKLIVALYTMPTDDLERLIDAAQLIDSEGQDALDTRPVDPWPLGGDIRARGE